MTLKMREGSKFSIVGERFLIASNGSPTVIRLDGTLAKPEQMAARSHFDL
jgi:hypothetical protein